MDIWHFHYEKKKIVDPTNSELSIKNSLSLSLRSYPFLSENMKSDRIHG